MQELLTLHTDEVDSIMSAREKKKVKILITTSIKQEWHKVDQ